MPWVGSQSGLPETSHLIQEKFAPDSVFQDKLVLGVRPDQDQDRRSVVHITLHRSLLGPHPGPTTKQEIAILHL